MHNFALNKQFFKVLCLKSLKFIKTVLFSFFSARTCKCKKMTKIYFNSTLTSFSQFILQFYYGLWYKHSHKYYLFAQSDSVSSKKIFFTKYFHSNYALWELRICIESKIQNPKSKIQNPKDMGLWQKPICRGPCFLKCKNITGFPNS